MLHEQLEVNECRAPSIKSPPVTDNSIVPNDAGIRWRANSFSDTKHSTVEKATPWPAEEPCSLPAGCTDLTPSCLRRLSRGSGH